MPIMPRPWSGSHVKSCIQVSWVMTKMLWACQSDTWQTKVAYARERSHTSIPVNTSIHVNAVFLLMWEAHLTFHTVKNSRSCSGKYCTNLGYGSHMPLKADHCILHLFSPLCCGNKCYYVSVALRNIGICFRYLNFPVFLQPSAPK